MGTVRWWGAATLLIATACAAPPGAKVPFSLKKDGETNQVSFAIEGQEAFVYQYDGSWAIPHIWPLRSPSGRSLLVQVPDPYPHHRSLWIVDRVQLEDGPVTDFYHEWKNLRDKDKPELGHHAFIRHDRFSELHTGTERAVAVAELAWGVQDNVPVLDQTLRMELEPLGNGEYLLHIGWELRAAHGDVKFLSDWVHYAWPYLRMEPAFSGGEGGTITDDLGRTGQEATNEQYASWVDYSNTVDGITEGLTVFTPEDGQQRKWLTREYGTFGPRRPDEWSGSKFTLKRGEKLDGQVTILVHRGDVSSGQVAERRRSLTPDTSLSTTGN